MCIRDSSSPFGRPQARGTSQPWSPSVIYHCAAEDQYMDVAETREAPVSYTHLRAHETRRHL
eukprot:310080-Prorocentrum_lima.AAC.1